MLATVASSLGDLLIKTDSDIFSPSPTFLTAVVPVNLRPLLAVITGQIPDANVNNYRKTVDRIHSFIHSLFFLHLSLSCSQSPLSEQIKMLQGNKIGGLMFDLPLKVDGSEEEAVVGVMKATSKVTGW